MLLNECGLYPLDVEKEIPDEAFASDLIGFNLSGRQLPLFLIRSLFFAQTGLSLFVLSPDGCVKSLRIGFCITTEWS